MSENGAKSPRSISESSTRALVKWAGLKQKPLPELLDLIYRFTRRVAFHSSGAAEIEQTSELPSNAEMDFWYAAFHDFFLQTTREETDDLLFFVKNKGFFNPENGDPLFVRRNHPSVSSTIPTRSDPLVHWEESFFLNAICNCFQYTLSFAVCARKTASLSSPSNSPSAEGGAESHSFLRRWRVIHCISKNVYATPSRQRMDRTKDDRHTTTYPDIYFCIDDFEHIFHDAAVRNKDEYVCVEITARGGIHPGTSREVTIFQGAVGYDILRSELDSSQSSAPVSVIKTIFGAKGPSPTFFTISGPNRKGKAQMALLPISESASEGTDQSRLAGIRSIFAKSMEPAPALTPINCSLISISLSWQAIIKDLFTLKESSTIMSSVVSKAAQSTNSA